MPVCIPSKDCTDYPNQCGTNLFDGCANELDCSGSCGASELCCFGLCKMPACSANSDCNDGLICTTHDLCNSPSTCSASCLNNLIVACIDNDGCCPAACDVVKCI